MWSSGLGAVAETKPGADAEVRPAPVVMARNLSRSRAMSSLRRAPLTVMDGWSIKNKSLRSDAIKKNWRCGERGLMQVAVGLELGERGADTADDEAGRQLFGLEFDELHGVFELMRAKEDGVVLQGCVPHQNF